MKDTDIICLQDHFMKIFNSDKLQLQVVGFYPLPKNRLRTIYLTIRIVNITIFILQFFIMFKFVLENVSDLKLISGNLLYTITQLAFFSKCGNILVNSKKIRVAERYIKSKLVIPLNEEEKKLMNDSVNFGKLLSTVYRMALLGSLIFHCLNPFLKSNPDGSKRLPSSVSLPFDPMDYYYQVTIVLILIIVVGAWINTNVDIIAVTLISFGTGQMEILKYKFENVCSLKANESDEVIERKLTEYVEELDEIYR